jgi:SAM-dependent methyltransferase
VNTETIIVGPSDERDALRARLTGMWGSVADSWAQHADYADARGAETTEKLLALSRLARGERALELACGPGGLGLAAAQRVGPEGEVVLSDVASAMTAVAAARARALGLANVSFCELDLERIEQPDGTYDVVLCRDGLMFAGDPARALQEIRRVLRADGRVALAVWGPRERNPWLGLVLDAASAQIGAPVPPPGVPGPFSLGDADALDGLLAGAGFADVRVSELAVPLRAGSFEEWWARTSALAGPLAAILASMPEEARLALAARARDLTAAYRTPDGLEFPGVAVLATGRRDA